MAVSVKIPTQLRAATDGDSTAEVDGSTVGEVLDSLYERYGELRSRIAEDGGLRRFVNVYVGGEDIRFLDGLDTPVQRRRRGHDPAGGRRRLAGTRGRAGQGESSDRLDSCVAGHRLRLPSPDRRKPNAHRRSAAAQS